MKKFLTIAIVSVMACACNNNAAVNTEQDEQRLRDSTDAAQHIKDSLEVEAKMLEDMNSGTSGDSAQATGDTHTH